MKLFIIFVINLSFLSGGFICAKNTTENNNDPLPESRPGNFSVNYHVDGGMMYYFEDLYISSDSSFYLVNDGGAVSKLYFTVSPAEMDRLYSVFQVNRFDDIETYEEMVYDRGGENISLRWGKNKYCRISNSGITFITENWSSEWNACIKEVQKITALQSEAHKKDFFFSFGTSFFGRDIYMQVNRMVLIPNSTLMPEYDFDSTVTKSLKLAPGMHRVSLNIGKNYESFNITPDSSKGIMLLLKNDSLVYEYIK